MKDQLKHSPAAENSPCFLAGAELLALLGLHPKWPRVTLAKLRRDGCPARLILGRYLYPRAKTFAWLRGKSYQRELALAS